MNIKQSQLEEFIIDSGLVSKTDFSKAKKEAEEKGIGVDKILVNQSKLTEDDLRRMQAYVLGIPFVELKTQKIPFEILSMVAVDYCR